MRLPQFQRLIGIKRCDECRQTPRRPPRARQRPTAYPLQRIAGVNSDADDVAGGNALRQQTF